ncbi:MAG: RIP metalloprotease RseP [Clostridiales bacterium]|nr:RIP metalloprotease RseP [Clostridiales bacterium]
MIDIYILLVVVVFGLLITFHELGHFITAKLSGVRVNEFAIGMGPAIFKKQKDDTLYALRIIPFGGYCSMEGEDEDSDDPRAFHKKPLRSRIAIVTAGSLMNLIVGFLVLVFVFAPVKEWNVPTLSNVEPWSTTAGSLMPGDRILAIDDYRIVLFNDIFIGLDRGKTAPVYDIEVLRSGRKLKLEDVTIKQQAVKIDGKVTHRLGLGFMVAESNFVSKTKYVILNAYNLVRMVKTGIFDLLTGTAGADEMAGPIGIAKIMVDTAKESMPSLWFLVAFISINLGIMNLLPLPALDGGRLMFLLVELVRRKPVNPKYEGYVHAAGFIFLMILMVIVAFNDILKLFAQ